MTAPVIQHLAWDSDWLGLPVARVTGAAFASPSRAAQTLTQARREGVWLLYLVSSPDQLVANKTAEAVGAQLVDIKLTYHQKISSPEPITLAVGTHLLQAETLTPALRQLAVQSGEYSRFRHDARIDNTAFEALYTQWLHRTLAQGQVWTVVTANQTVGLLAFAGYESYASIELLAVAPAARRRGVGRCLVELARHLACQQGYNELRVVTQGANQPARNLYERSGFELLRAEHIYHLWL